MKLQASEQTGRSADECRQSSSTDANVRRQSNWNTEWERSTRKFLGCIKEATVILKGDARSDVERLDTYSSSIIRIITMATSFKKRSNEEHFGSNSTASLFLFNNHLINSNIQVECESLPIYCSILASCSWELYLNMNQLKQQQMHRVL